MTIIISFDHASGIPVLRGPLILPEERNNTKNTLLRIIPMLSPSYIVKFDFKPTSFQRGYTSILHLTATGNDCCYFGDRLPGIWFHGTWKRAEKNRLRICSAVNGIGSYCLNSGVTVPRGQWTTIEISQRPDGVHYIYQVKVDGVYLGSVLNRQPRFFYDVKVYGSDSWYNAAEGTIRNLLIEPYAEGKVFDCNASFMNFWFA